MNNGEMLIYQNAEGNIKVDVLLEDETVWLMQDQMAILFGKAKSTINEHILNVYADHELVEEGTMRKIGNSDFSTKPTNFYNLDVVISVGYRVKSIQGTQFRIWATQRLKDYIIKGFSLNDDRFKSGNSMNYFNELQDRIREIRISEKFFYQKIKDIYTTSIDYDSKDEKTIAFLKQYRINYSGQLVNRLLRSWCTEEWTQPYLWWECSLWIERVLSSSESGCKCR